MKRLLNGLHKEGLAQQTALHAIHQIHYLIKKKYPALTSSSTILIRECLDEIARENKFRA